jgi:23S rRNA (adenine2503-C2)-methyltransferase
MDLSFDSLKAAFSDEPKFRLSQAIKVVYEQGIASWDEATIFSKDLRARLKKDCPLSIDAEHTSSKDGKTIKANFNFNKDVVEAVLMRHQGRNTVCVSTQVGCALNCGFCLTGAMGFTRNLNVDEMINQILYFSRLLKIENERVTNIVFMGMGEPFNNYDTVLKAITKINDISFFNIGARHISISTSGVVPGIKRLIKEKLQVNLSVSLHASSDEVRDTIMPINKTYPIKDLLKAVREYIGRTRRRVMIEYVMLKGINDSPSQANSLIKLLQTHLGELYFVNIIQYNPTGKFEASDRRTMNVFKRILEKSGIAVVERYRFGQDIQGACGQLSNVAEGKE